MSDAVRLSASEMKAIIDASQVVCKGISLRRIGVFGSRSNLNEKGGDIDLFFEIDGAIDIQNLASQLRVAIANKIGEQKIDIFIRSRSAPPSSSASTNFYEMIKNQIVTIWSIHD